MYCLFDWPVCWVIFPAGARRMQQMSRRRIGKLKYSAGFLISGRKMRMVVGFFFKQIMRPMAQSQKCFSSKLQDGWHGVKDHDSALFELLCVCVQV